MMMPKKPKTFADYKLEGYKWITLATGEYYPDILKDACELYTPVLILFGQLIEKSESSERLLIQISDIPNQWMRIQLARVFRKYVSPFTPVEMLKRKTKVQEICEQSAEFMQNLDLPENWQFRQLVVTPLFLHLACWVFQGQGKFPTKRAEFYKQGLDLLLGKWDEARGVERDDAYRGFLLPQKLRLLSQLAAVTFEQGQYFLEQRIIEQYISDYLQNLPDATLEASQKSQQLPDETKVATARAFYLALAQSPHTADRFALASTLDQGMFLDAALENLLVEIVEVKNGKVTVSGTVATPEQLQQIQPLLKSIPGIGKVDMTATVASKGVNE